MQKNIAGQKWVVYAFDRTTNEPKTGDAANITAKIGIDGAAAGAIADTNPIEREGGKYVFDIAQAESNGGLLTLYPESSTSNIIVYAEPGSIYTVAPNFNTLGIASDGDLTKVNTLNGHTAQTGDNYPILNNVVTEPTALGGSLPNLVALIYRRFYNKVTQTSTQQKVYKDNSSTVIGTMTVSDDGTTQTKGKAT